LSFKPDYNLYSNSDLIDVFENIDREHYPQRFHELCEIMKGKNLLKYMPATDTFNTSELVLVDDALAEDDSITEHVPAYTDSPPIPKYDSEGNYVPNTIVLKKRIVNFCVALAIMAYGGYGLYIDQLWVPLSKYASIRLIGIAAIFMFIAIICASIEMITEVLDHYDKRDNEHTYYKIANLFKYASYMSFAIAIFTGFSMGASLS
jgi:hypothetical protein